MAEENKALQPLPAGEPELPAAPKRGRRKKETAVVPVQEIAIENDVRTATYHEGQVITIDRTATVERVNEAQEMAWHELTNSLIRKSILTGRLVSMETHRISAGENINVAVVEYQGYRIVIPTSEMNIIIGGAVEEGKERQAKITSNMVGCDVDFVVMRMDEESHSVIASRRLAMERKVQDFYIDKTASGKPVINVGSVVEARIVAVSETVLRLEVFGTECFTRVFDIVEEWMADARERYSVGDTVYVKVSSIEFDSKSRPVIKVEGKSLTAPKVYACVKQGKYSGVVTGINKGIYFIRLDIGVNAIAHTCKGEDRLPKRKDVVSFICTRMDEEGRVAVGLISRVIKPFK